MKILHDISLRDYNSFGIDVRAKDFVEITSVDELRQVLQRKEYPKRFILSGGSNMLLTQDIEALVLFINLKGIRILWEDEEQAAIKVMAGENWHELVMWTLDHGFGGLENLSLIPGNTGTAPIQNIGAYGVEIKDVFESCEAMEIDTQRLIRFDKEACRFGYRDSFFKNEGKGRYIITSVNLILSKKQHKLHTSYGAIESELRSENIGEPSIRDISNAVISIRQRKLPDPREIGNSGSFFKNPVLTSADFETFNAKNPEAPHYKSSDNTYKVPAGWLIEQCGYKGKRIGDAGVHKDQALVLVNYGNASGTELLALAESIKKDVKLKFGIELVPEVNII